MLPTSQELLTRHGRSPVRLLRRLALVAGCGLAALAVPALAVPALADPAPAGPAAPVVASIPTPPTDMMLARSAMAALDADPRLKEVALIVSVVDRVAVIGGPVPSADHKGWAEERVRAVPGIAAVTNRCFVRQSKSDPLVRAVADRLAGDPRPLNPDLPPVVPGLKPMIYDVATGPGIGIPKADVNPTVALRPAADTTGFLLPPVNPAGPVVGPVSPPFPNIPPPVPGVLTATPPVPAIDPTKPESVLVAAETVRRADPRFARLTLQRDGGYLVIGGSAARSSDAWDLSDALRRVPGMGKVVVGTVEVR